MNQSHRHQPFLSDLPPRPHHPVVLRISQLVETVKRVVAVEIVGKYSETQWMDLKLYNSTFRSFSLHVTRLVLYIWGASVAIYSIPQIEPSRDWKHQFPFYVLCTFTYLLAGHSTVNFYALLFPELEFTRLQTLWLAMPFALSSSAVLAAIASSVGFPVPFGLLFTTLTEIITLAVPVYAVSRKRIHRVKHFWPRFRKFGIIVVLVMLFMILYPLATVPLASLKSEVSKMLFALVFPCMKFIFRFLLFHSSSGTISAVTPTICVFTIEFFNSFYLVVMLQDGITLNVVLPLIGFDIVSNIVFVTALWKLGRKMNGESGTSVHLKALHVSEFVILTEFIECLVPLLYGSILIALYYGPNRDYFAQFQNKTESDVLHLCFTLAILFILELVILIIVIVLLYKSVAINLIHQLDFRLSRQWYFIANLIAQFLCTTLAMNLVHFGFDFTFEFEWLD